MLHLIPDYIGAVAQLGECLTGSQEVAGSIPASSTKFFQQTNSKYSMRLKNGILFFGLTEIAIGTVTLAATLQNLFTGIAAKPLNVAIFVIASSLISISLGAGVLLRFSYARKFLIFFAGWIILSKILIFARILILCCSLETAVPFHVKNIISIIYHTIVIFYFHHPTIKAEFKR